MRNKLSRLALGAATLSAFVAPVLARGYDYSYSYSSDGMDAISLVILCCVCVFSLVYLGLKIYLTVDAFKRNYGEDSNMKIIGILMIWILDWIVPLVGLILYYFLVMRKYPKSE